MNEERAARLAFHEAMAVVHPRVVASKVAAADEEEIAGLGGAIDLVEASGEPPEIRGELARRHVHASRARLEDGGQARLQRAEIDPVRVLFEVAQGEPLLPGQE